MSELRVLRVTRETHERNVLVWLAAKLTYNGCLRFLVIPLFLALALLLSGCGVVTGGDTTGPEAPKLEHPREVLMSAIINCNADFHGMGFLDLYFTEKRENVTLPDGRLAFVACRAGMGASHVTCERRWVHEAKRVELAYAAAHEVCHITGDYAEPPLECMKKPLEACK